MKKMIKKYELIDHTADIAIKAFGDNLEESFENAAKAMFDFITDNSEIKKIGQYDITLEAPDFEQLLVDWLSELLFLNSAKNLVFGEFDIKIDNPNNIAIDLAGLDYGLKINQSSLFSGTKNDPLNIGAKGSSTIQIPLSLKYEDIYYWQFRIYREGIDTTSFTET